LDPGDDWDIQAVAHLQSSAPMKHLRLIVLLLFAGIALTTLVVISVYNRMTAVAVEEPVAMGATGLAIADAEMEELVAFRNATRQLYNNRKFAELEALAATIRSGKERIGTGSWKIFHFYDSLNCREDEPESMWKLHDTLHREWVTAYPESITARVARADFLTTYAWQARSDAYAEEVTAEGWRLFRDRLAEARTILEQSRRLTPPCPVWWLTCQTVALGQDWSRAEYDALFQDAKKFEPEFFAFDLANAKYLLPKWHGEPGDWEAAAEKEIGRPGTAGYEIYARVVTEQADHYNNIFEQSSASWRKTRKGYEELLARYPESKHLLNEYCRLACYAGDRKLAKELFTRIGEMKVRSAWRKGQFDRAKAWAMGGS
jgi:Domain of unknown function (DUF4034)